MSLEIAPVLAAVIGVGALLQGATLLVINSGYRRTSRERWRDDADQARAVAELASAGAPKRMPGMSERPTGHRA